jgi:hypothetical protein
VICSESPTILPSCPDVPDRSSYRPVPDRVLQEAVRETAGSGVNIVCGEVVPHVVVGVAVRRPRQGRGYLKSMANRWFGRYRSYAMFNPPASSACNDFAENWADAWARSCFKVQKSSRTARLRRHGLSSPDREQMIFPGCAARAALKATLGKCPTERWTIGSNDVVNDYRVLVTRTSAKGRNPYIHVCHVRIAHRLPRTQRE